VGCWVLNFPTMRKIGIGLRTYLPLLWRWFNTPEGILRSRLVYDIFTLIFWFLYYYVKTKYIYRITCPNVWTTEYCDAYVSAQTFWINLPFFGALFIDIVVFYFIHKHITKLKALTWFRRVMVCHCFLVIFWTISATSTNLWGIFPFLLIGIAFDVYVLIRIGRLQIDYEQISHSTYVL